MRRRTYHAITILVVWLFIFTFVFLGAWENGSAVAQLSEIPDDFSGEAERLGEKIRELRFKIGELKKKEDTLVNELSRLDTEIEIVRLNGITIEHEYEREKQRVGEKEKELTLVSFELRNKQAVLGELVRSLWRDYEGGILEIILANDTFSDFFNGVHELNTLEKDAENVLGEVRDIKLGKQRERELLERERLRALGQKELSLLAKVILEEKIKARQSLLLETRGSETRYRALLGESRERLKAIRRDLYEFSTLGLTLDYEAILEEVRRAAERTGVRPSLLLAVLKVESNLGRNVGRGYWKTDMHPRDFEAFAQITSSLGLDPNTTPVSAEPEYGWGGAMGPLQFLPSTWMGYRDEVASLTGHNPPSPWNLEDALTAAGLKLARHGAATHEFQDEWRSAMMYFAGDNWNDPRFSFYGDTVLNFASIFEGEFDLPSLDILGF